MPATRQIGRRLLAFKWAALAFTALATAAALRELLEARNTSEVLSVPHHFLPVSQNVVPHPVSDFTIGMSLIVLVLIVVVQFILLGFTQLGRRHAVIPIVTEIALWIGFCLASYEVQKGYRAVVACVGPPTHCSVTYPSVIPALISGFQSESSLALLGEFSTRSINEICPPDHTLPLLQASLNSAECSTPSRQRTEALLLSFSGIGTLCWLS